MRQPLFHGVSRKRLGISCVPVAATILALTAFSLGACRNRNPNAEGGQATASQAFSLGRSQDPWNVVLIVIDTLRRDRLGSFGYSRNTSPTIDQLASDGATIRATSPTSWTLPATASLLSGLHPIRHQTYSEDDRLPDKVVTLAQMFLRNGYSTAGVSANLWISEKFGFDRGFEVFHDMGQLGYGHVAAADKVNKVLIPLLDELHPPYFLYVHYIDPHVPYEPPYGWDGEELSDGLRSRVPMDNQDFSPLSFVKRDPELVKAASDLYDGEIRFVDSEIARLMARLSGKNLLRNTITIITSDHGEEFEDHGRMGHGHSLFHELTEVPMVINAPELIPAGISIPRASLMDVVPTLIQILGLEPSVASMPYSLDGQSLAAGLIGREFSEFDEDRSFLTHLDHRSGLGVGFDDGSFKIVVTDRPYFKGFYDIGTDPLEMENLEPDAFLNTFQDLGEDFVSTFNAYQEGAFPRSRFGNLDQNVIEGLRALGYETSSSDETARHLPRQMFPPDPFKGGLRGFENADVFLSCIEIGRAENSPQLLDGWHAAGNSNGKYTWPVATAALKVPEAATNLRLTIAGINYRKAPFGIEMKIQGRTVFSSDVPGGSFDLAVAIPDRLTPGSLAVVQIAVDEPFHPWEHGLNDNRVLGVFVSRLCLDSRR